MSDEQEFAAFRENGITELGHNSDIQSATRCWMDLAQKGNYSYHFNWMGRPIIQYPQDIVAMQELIWSVRPDVVIETGIARGGSLIFSASMLALLDICDLTASGGTFDPRLSNRFVLGIDVDIREHNRKAIESHPMGSRIRMIQGSSIDQSVIEQVHRTLGSGKRVLVCLDSNHTHDHVLAELEAYASLVSVGSYCVVFDTIVEKLSPEAIGERPWAPGNNPMTAVHCYLRQHPEFEIDRRIDHKLQISVAPDGYLKRVQ